MEPLTPPELQVWLEWAGSRLMALSVGRIKPAEPHVVWPEYNTDTYQVLDHRKVHSRAPAPPSADIPIMDKILLFPNLCEWETTRRVVHARLLVYPLSHKYVHKWTAIARLVSSDAKTVREWHRKGLLEMTRKLPSDSVCQVREFLVPPSISP